MSPVGISTTPLATFDECARRYRLLHELAVEPPPFAISADSRPASEARDDRRALGTAAHRVLERWPLARWGEPTDRAEVVERLAAEGLAIGDFDALDRVAGNVAAFLGGSYAARVRDADGAVYREERFVVPIACEGGPLWLHGTIDLLVTLADGSAEILDYKSSWRPELRSYDFQLRSYALAARRRYGASRVRVGVLNLADAQGATLTELGPEELDAFERRLGDLKSRFTLARATGDFPGVPRPTCEAFRCGFVGACHRA